LLLLLWQLMVAMTTTPHPHQSHADQSLLWISVQQTASFT